MATVSSYQPRGLDEQADILDRSGSGGPWCRGRCTGNWTSVPANVIRIVAPYSASTPPDIVARIVASALSDGEGWKVVVENKPGGVMTLGAMEVLRQAADGYTLFSVTSPIAAVRPALLPNASFKIESDFTPLIRVATGYNVLVVNPNVPVNSVPELITYLKAQPGKYTFSSGKDWHARSSDRRVCSSLRPASRRRMSPTRNSRRRSPISSAE